MPPSSAAMDQTTFEVTSSNPAEALDLRLLVQRLHQVLSESDTEAEATRALLGVTQQLCKARAVVYFGEDSTGELSATPCGQTSPAIADSTMNKLYSLAMMAKSAEMVQIARTEQAETLIAVAVPVLRLQRSTEAIVILADGGEDLTRRLAGLVQIGQFLATYAGQWRGRYGDLQEAGELLRVDQLCEVLLQSSQAERISGAASFLADGLSELLSARVVGIGLCGIGRQIKLVGMSRKFQFDRSSELAKCFEAVMAETLLSENLPDDSREMPGRTTEAVQKLASMVDAPTIHRAPLRNVHGDSVGAYVAVSDQTLSPQLRPEMELAERLVGQQLELLRSARRRPIRQLVRQFKSLSRQHQKWVVGGAVAALLILFVIPVPHRLKSKCEVQPVTRRFVAAPYEGRLESALVEPGDWVTNGQTLARMDAREIRLELASVEADLVRAIKQRDTAMASRETAAAQMAHFEMERLDLKVQMLKDRMDNLEIKSPTDGVVISGDPKKLEGSRLTMGQTLVEVGPLGNMFLEVGIPDESIAYAKVGQPVWFRLESLPQARFHGVLTRIHPRSEERESANVFIGEVRIESDNEPLRPGMRGRAKITADRRSLFWVLFHRAWEQVFFNLG